MTQAGPGVPIHLRPNPTRPDPASDPPGPIRPDPTRPAIQQSLLAVITLPSAPLAWPTNGAPQHCLNLLFFALCTVCLFSISGVWFLSLCIAVSCISFSKLNFGGSVLVAFGGGCVSCEIVRFVRIICGCKKLCGVLETVV